MSASQCRGVFPCGAAHPPMRPGAQRNVVQVFFGRNMAGIPAFLIMTVLTEDGEVVLPPAPADDAEGTGP